MVQCYQRPDDEFKLPLIAMQSQIFTFSGYCTELSYKIIIYKSLHHMKTSSYTVWDSRPLLALVRCPQGRVFCLIIAQGSEA